MYHNILVPVAFDHERDESAPLKLAALLAAPGAKITLLHVVEALPTYAVSYLSEEYLEKTQAALQAELDKIAAQVPNSEAVVIDGHSGRSIVGHAEEINADLIIIASHRPEIQDFFLGSTAARVVRHAPCAVHVVR